MSPKSRLAPPPGARAGPPAPPTTIHLLRDLWPILTLAHTSTYKIFLPRLFDPLTGAVGYP